MKLKEQIVQRFDFIYKGNYDPSLIDMLLKKIETVKNLIKRKNTRWTEKDVVLITYGDSIKGNKEKPLLYLKKFIDSYLPGVFSIVHILPFFPYSSDDGFSVIDYKEVDPLLGEWKHIHKLSSNCRIMADLVINHTSQESQWFKNYLKGVPPGKDYFIESDPSVNLSAVVRPRSLPLLTCFETNRGPRYVWTTFSADQVDLNFANPNLLAEMIDILLFYFIQGISVIRLDAIAFLWKKPGTSCLHLPETHEVVKLIRDITEFIDPSIILITETNVPNNENLSYFGNEDEAHMIYNFSLPPLVLYTLFSGNSSFLSQWASSLPDISGNCSFLNFTASHDGIGVRPLEGLLPSEKFNQLIDGMKKFGGLISTRSTTDGKDIPYEINITYFDALKGTHLGEDKYQFERFICSQVIMLSMKGIPAVYINNIVGGSNNIEGVKKTSTNRTINRQKWEFEELSKQLTTETIHSKVLSALSKVIKIRKQTSAFHPDSDQKIEMPDNSLFVLKRDNGKLVSVSNIGFSETMVNRNNFCENCADMIDLLSGKPVETIFPLQPYQTVWLTRVC